MFYVRFIKTYTQALLILLFLLSRYSFAWCWLSKIFISLHSFIQLFVISTNYIEKHKNFNLQPKKQFNSFFLILF